MKEGIEGGKVVRCQKKGCGGLVKPDIVFFGEGLPDKFFDCLSVSCGLCDELGDGEELIWGGFRIWGSVIC
jgi:NAD-dependent SIR2 family protein deacetylase